MNDEPISRLNPDQLREGRHDVDFGTDAETGHDHMGREPGRAPADSAEPIAHPTSGATPPAR